MSHRSATENQSQNARSTEAWSRENMPEASLSEARMDKDAGLISIRLTDLILILTPAQFSGVLPPEEPPIGASTRAFHFWGSHQPITSLRPPPPKPYPPDCREETRASHSRPSTARSKLCRSSVPAFDGVPAAGASEIQRGNGCPGLSAFDPNSFLVVCHQKCLTQRTAGLRAGEVSSYIW